MMSSLFKWKRSNGLVESRQALTRNHAHRAIFTSVLFLNPQGTKVWSEAPEFGRSEESGEGDTVALDFTAPHSWHTFPAGHVHSAGQPLHAVSLQIRR